MNKGILLQNIQRLKETESISECSAVLLRRVGDAGSLFFLTIEHGNPLQQIEATKHCIVSFVSALEVFCKETIVEFAGKWNEKGLSKLLSEKITLADAYSLFKESNVKRESILAHHYTSFQNLAKIAEIFDTLTDKKFFNELHKFDFVQDGYITCMDQVNFANNSEWREDLSTLMSLRHKIIHENNDAIKLSISDVERFEYLISIFGVIMYEYCKDAKSFNL